MSPKRRPVPKKESKRPPRAIEVPRGKKIVVQLGNLGHSDVPVARETFLRATAEPGTQFYGIDRLIRAVKEKVPPNWFQVRADFVRGLQRFRPESVDEITSVLALGHYGREKELVPIAERFKYTASVLLQAWKVLKPGGKIEIVTSVGNSGFVKNAFVKAGISKESIEERAICKGDIRTPYIEDSGLLRPCVLSVKK